MFKIAGEEYYFDLNKMSEFVRFYPTNSHLEDILGGTDNEEDMVDDDVIYDNVDPSQMIDVTKWEMTKACVETIIAEGKLTDNKMGLKGLEGEMSLASKLAFNTLYKYKMITNE